MITSHHDAGILAISKSAAFTSLMNPDLLWLGGPQSAMARHVRDSSDLYDGSNPISGALLLFSTFAGSPPPIVFTCHAYYIDPHYNPSRSAPLYRLTRTFSSKRLR